MFGRWAITAKRFGLAAGPAMPKATCFCEAWHLHTEVTEGCWCGFLNFPTFLTALWYDSARLGSSLVAREPDLRYWIDMNTINTSYCDKISAQDSPVFCDLDPAGPMWCCQPPCRWICASHLCEDSAAFVSKLAGGHKVWRLLDKQGHCHRVNDGFVWHHCRVRKCQKCPDLISQADLDTIFRFESCSSRYVSSLWSHLFFPMELWCEDEGPEVTCGGGRTLFGCWCQSNNGRGDNCAKVWTDSGSQWQASSTSLFVGLALAVMISPRTASFRLKQPTRMVTLAKQEPVGTEQSLVGTMSEWMLDVLVIILVSWFLTRWRLSWTRAYSRLKLSWKLPARLVPLPRCHSTTYIYTSNVTHFSWWAALA